MGFCNIGAGRCNLQHHQHGSSCSGRTNIGGLLFVILYICFPIGIGSRLDVFQIPQHRKALFDIVTIHPFYNGNGRTSRLLMNYLQAYFNLPMSIVFLNHKIEYYHALVATRTTENIELFRTFMHAQYVKFLQSEIDKFEAINKPSSGKGYSLVF